MKILYFIFAISLVLQGCASDPHFKEKALLDLAMKKFDECRDTGLVEKHRCAQQLYLDLDKLDSKTPARDIFLEHVAKIHDLYLMNFEKKIDNEKLKFELTRLKSETVSKLQIYKMQYESRSYSGWDALGDFSSSYSKGMQQNSTIQPFGRPPIFCNPTGSGSYVCN